MILVKEKEIVTPGEVLVKGLDYIPGQGCYRREEEIISKVVGMVSIDKKIIKVIPLSGRYIPKKGDTIIGRVIDITLSGWRLDINSPYTAMLMAKDATHRLVRKGEDLSRILDIGDYVLVKIKNVTSQNLVDVVMNEQGLKKLDEGVVIKITPVKVPRVIGTRGSMVSMIKKETNTNIIVGQNGLVWISGKEEGIVMAVNAIKKIEREAHISGLTDKIKEMLTKKKE